MLEQLGRHARSGDTIVRHLAEDPAFEGIGYATAAKLWEAFGERLYALLGDVASLTAVLNEDRAERLVLAWKEKLAEGDVVVWLDEHGFEKRLAKKIIRLWGAEAAAKLREQPYAMMALADWPIVDAAGRKMGIAADDPRRLVAAVEAALYARLDQHHTWIGERDLVAAAGRLLKCAPARAGEAVAAAVAQRAAIPIAGGFQAAGAHMMERYVADRIREMLTEPAMGDLIAREVSDAELAAWLDRQDMGVALDDEQREAVRIAVQERFGIVRGGAGVGKTTVLRAVARACAAFGRSTHMMALAGRAAVRIGEATGFPASTIAAFLKGVEARKIPLGPESLVVVDEASMLDLPTMYRILRALPDGCRLLLVGDPGQLPPIQFGLVLHALGERPEIPSVVLTRVYRQTEATGIPAVAGAVRSGRLPSLPDKACASSGGVALIPAGEVTTDQIVDVVAGLGGFSEDLRIVCAVKAGPAGTEALNARFHDIFAVGRRRHPTRRLAEGEPVMFLKNDYQAGLRNGSLGRITSIEEGRVAVDFDGTEVELSGYGLDDLTLAYAITVHKAQGSSFRKVVIPVQKTRLLDRSLIYTAISRAKDSAVLVGASEVLQQSLERDAHAGRRETALALLMEIGSPES
ncbi:AAA family ATPase [Bradyrhizobium daqingense]|uniref:Exodeoxyribonuclease V alpha subunit n=1 Tax=Bradyrhizobium daqingense TaxID=993502 RepID=A0A562KWI1_9BRAD|nr:AAA family ATPase [Bradyrhizobium daqingense]TWH99780.1 exodeoxyribonuclease V alpha subunit [Bradyrhizobium daqingense]UFS86962.1 AAA family ATPase [Bradyrhizobium daqingense]